MPEGEFNGGTSLHSAASLGDGSLLRHLIALGADVNSTDNMGGTPLHLSAHKGRTEPVNILLTEGADVDAKDMFGSTPLHYAAGDGHEDVMEMLLEGGADPNARNDAGQTPLSFAVLFNRPNAASVLHRHGAELVGDEDDSVACSRFPPDLFDPALRESFPQVELQQLRQQLSGSKYSELVGEHMRELGDGLEVTVIGPIPAFNETERAVLEDLIDAYNLHAYNRKFWARDCGEVFGEICETFDSMMTENGQTAEDRITFQVFQIVTGNFAIMARDQASFRSFAGVRAGRTCAKIAAILRWVVMLPTALLAGLVSHGLVYWVNRLTMSRYLDPDSFFGDASVQFFAKAAMGWVLVYVGARVAPGYRKHVALVMGGIVLLLAGSLLLPFIASGAWPKLIGIGGLILGGCVAAHGICTAEIKVGRNP